MSRLDESWDRFAMFEGRRPPRIAQIVWLASEAIVFAVAILHIFGGRQQAEAWLRQSSSGRLSLPSGSTAIFVLTIMLLLAIIHRHLVSRRDAILGKGDDEVSLMRLDAQDEQRARFLVVVIFAIAAIAILIFRW